MVGSNLSIEIRRTNGYPLVIQWLSIDSRKTASISTSNWYFLRNLN